MRILVAYGTSHGSTAAIAARIADRLRAHGAAVVIGDVRQLARDASGFDAIIVGARVWGSRYPRRVARFIQRNLETLRRSRSAFFSVCLWNVSALEDHRAEAVAIPHRFLAQMGWKADRVEVIAGTLAFSRAQFGCLGRRLFRAIWKNDLGLLDTSRDYTFTDWNQVDAFADSFLGVTSKASVPGIGLNSA